MGDKKPTSQATQKPATATQKPTTSAPAANGTANGANGVAATPAAQSSEGLTARFTDIYNAEQLLARYGTDLKWVSTWGKGLVWDGARWALDETNRWAVRAHDTAREMFREAVKAFERATQQQDTKEIAKAKKEIAHGVQTQGAPRLAAMQSVARPLVSITHDDLDADRWLLNVRNGTIDLRTGAVRPHRRGDNMTKLADVVYDARAACPQWDAFLLTSMGGDVDMVTYLQKLVGYSLTGIVTEHLLVFFHGDGSNGKSTFLGVVHEMLGDYAAPSPRNFLFHKKFEGHPTELVVLHGRRFVTCTEIEEGKVFDEALVKDLTGGDRLSARRMKEDFWHFDPTHKLFIAGQHKPSVRGDDEGIWRRMRLIPWTVRVAPEKKDTQLKEKLLKELPGILAWAVRGCVQWQREGLKSPRAVEAATDQYRAENNLLGEFFRVNVVFEADAVLSRRALRDLYEAYCQGLGAEPFGARRFTERLRQRGVALGVEVTDAKKRIGGSMVDAWRGIRLATPAEQQANLSWRSAGRTAEV